jgi:tetratricopeptide (TPR) repeat protein
MKKSLIAMLILTSVYGCGQKEPEELVERGAQYFASSDYKSASLEFKSALQVDPTMTSARVGLAKIYLAERNFDAAIIELKKISHVDGDIAPTEIEVLLARALYHNDMGNDLLMMNAGANSEITYYQVSELVKGKDSDLLTAEGLLDTVDGDTYFKRLSAAKIGFAQMGESTVGDLNELLLTANADIEKSEGLIFAASVVSERNLLDETIEYLTQYLVMNKNDHERELQLVHILVHTDKVAQARDLTLALLKKFPKHPMVNQIASMVYFEDKEYDLALAAASIALVSSPNEISPRLVAAYSESAKGRTDAALANLDFIIDNVGTDHPAQRLYVRLKVESGLLGDAVDAAIRLTSLKAEDVPLLSNLGLEMVRAGQMEKAKTLMDMVAGMDASAEQRAVLGLLQLSLSQELDGFATLESSLKEDPTSELVGNSVASAYLAAERFEDAENLADSWVLAGKKIEGGMLKGVVRARLGDYDSALGLFKGVLLSDSNNYMAKAGIVEVMVAMGKTEEVKQELKAWMMGAKNIGLFKVYLSAMRLKNEDVGVKDAYLLLADWIEEKSLGDVSGEDVRGDWDSLLYIAAQTAFLAKEYRGSEKLLLGLGQEYHGDVLYWTLMSNLAIQREDMSGALDSFKKWQVLAPLDPAPMLGAIQVLSGQMRFIEAEALLDASLPNFENKIPGEILKAQLYMKQEKWHEMSLQIEKLPGTVIQSQIGQALIGVINVHEGKFKEGLDRIYPFALNTSSEDFLRWVLVAMQESKSTENLEFLLVEHLKKKPKSWLANFALANNYAEKENFEAAETHYEAVKLAGSNAMVLNNLAFSQWKNGKIDEAKKNASRAVKIEPDSPAYMETLASIMIDTGESALAKEMMQALVDKKVALNASFAETFIKVGGIL